MSTATSTGRVQVRRQSAAAVLALVVLMLLAWGWDRVSDVVWFEEARIVQVSEHSVQMTVGGWQIRQGCRMVAGSAVGFVQDELDEWHEAEFLLIENLTQVQAPEPWYLFWRRWFARKSFGMWRWDSDERTPVAVMLTVSHDCSEPVPDKPKPALAAAKGEGEPVIDKPAPKKLTAEDRKGFQTTTMGPWPVQ